MEHYKRKVHYYETDKMGVVHHSNYIRWYEEARTHFMQEIGFGYDGVEEMGIIIPVLSVLSKYILPFKYGEEFEVRIRVAQYNGVKVSFEYEVYDTVTGKLKNTGTSQHCFVDSNFRPVALKKAHPDFDAVIKALVAEEKE